jgi:hypothetical protein
MSRNRTWNPLQTDRRRRPETGNLIALDHAVWRIAAVTDLPFSDTDRETWMDVGMPDPATWHGRPYRADVDWVAGVRPDWALTGPVDTASVDIAANNSWSGAQWDVYPPSGRWPQCSCCGEPMPCRAEMEDREVTAGLNLVEKFAKRLPGCCWGCEEPITRRQKSVTYAGDNLDLPGGPEARFHTRADCHYYACRYELRWIAVDPRRERVLTYPKCAGILVVHGDGSSECRSGTSALGGVRESERECRGHLTHDHAAHQACYVGDSYFVQLADMPGCPRGCPRDETHPGTRTTPRPPRVAYAQPTL